VPAQGGGPPGEPADPEDPLASGKPADPLAPKNVLNELREIVSYTTIAALVSAAVLLSYVCRIVRWKVQAEPRLEAPSAPPTTVKELKAYKAILDAVAGAPEAETPAWERWCWTGVWPIAQNGYATLGYPTATRFDAHAATPAGVTSSRLPTMDIAVAAAIMLGPDSAGNLRAATISEMQHKIEKLRADHAGQFAGLRLEDERAARSRESEIAALEVKIEDARRAGTKARELAAAKHAARRRALDTARPVLDKREVAWGDCARLLEKVFRAELPGRGAIEASYTFIAKIMPDVAGKSVSRGNVKKFLQRTGAPKKI
jgi:hypothetical protein